MELRDIEKLLDQKLSALDHKIEQKLLAALEPIKNDLLTIKTDVSAIRTHTDAINTRLYKLESRMANVENHLDGHLEQA